MCSRETMSNLQLTVFVGGLIIVIYIYIYNILENNINIDLCACNFLLFFLSFAMA